MKKRILALSICLVMLVVCLCGCGGADGSADNSKGSRSDPYRPGEAITFTAMYDDAEIEVNINVDSKIIGESEIKDLYRNNNVITNWMEKAMVTFTISCNGNFDSEIDLENLAQPILVTSDMKEDATYGTLKDDSWDNITNIYTGVDYFIYEGTKDFTADECKYLRFAYENTDGEDADIWVELK